MTPVGARHALLYDTEAALRLIDGEMRALTGADGPPASPAFARAGAEVRAALASVRNSRAVIEALEAPDRARVACAAAVPAQPLALAAGALTDIEEQLLLLAKLLDQSADGRAAPRGAAAPAVS